VDCVSSVQIDQGSAQTRVVTTAPTKVNLTIFNESTRKNAVAIKASTTLSSNHDLDHTGLTPGRDYWYTVMPSGTDRKNLSIVRTIRTIRNTAPSKFRIDIEGVDDDCEGIGSLCSGGTM
jgi:phosphodiesterase/alkaline phosphatase D-like protein